MSARGSKGYADPQGKTYEVTQYGITNAQKAGTPTNGDAGYAPSCLYQNLTGTIGSLLYVNSGTVTSATWTNIT